MPRSKKKGGIEENEYRKMRCRYMEEDGMSLGFWRLAEDAREEGRKERESVGSWYKTEWCKKKRNRGK